MEKLVILLLVVAVASAYEHQGSKLFRVDEITESVNLQRAVLAKLNTLQEKFNIDFWLDPRLKGPTDFLVTPAQHELVTNYLQMNGIKHHVLLEDVGAVIEQQRVEAEIAAKQKRMTWSDYQRTETIQAWLEEVAAANPDIAEVITIGRSTLGRDLKLIKIGRPKPGVNKPALWADGGIHAREWISVATSTWFINQLLNNQTQNADIIDNVDWYIIPVTNVDGYEFTFTNTRLWRKTRSNHNSPGGCLGVDPNRNFGHQFGGSGSSNDKCSDIYRGPNAFSEPETEAMRNFIETARANGVDWRSYFAIHSYSQMWLTPWGYTYALPDTYSELAALGRLGANALTAVHGTQYRVGSVTQLLSPGAGGSDDWAYGSGIFRYSQTVELRDTGRYGFLLPREQIVASGEETWAALQVVARFIADQ